MPSSSEVDADAILKAYSEALGCGDDKAEEVARRFGLSADAVKRAVTSVNLIGHN